MILRSILIWREREGWPVWWWGVWSLPRAHPLIHFDQVLSFWKRVEWWTWRWWHYDESMMLLLKLFVPIKSWWWSAVNVGVTSVTLSQLILEATPIDWVLISCELSWKSKNIFSWIKLGPINRRLSCQTTIMGLVCIIHCIERCLIIGYVFCILSISCDKFDDRDIWIFDHLIIQNIWIISASHICPSICNWPTGYLCNAPLWVRKMIW